jgi:hypothetical protein
MTMSAAAISRRRAADSGADDEEDEEEDDEEEEEEDDDEEDEVAGPRPGALPLEEAGRVGGGCERAASPGPCAAAYLLPLLLLARGWADALLAPPQEGSCFRGGRRA